MWHEIEVVVGAVLLPARQGEPPFNAKQVNENIYEGVGMREIMLLLLVVLVVQQCLLPECDVQRRRHS